MHQLLSRPLLSRSLLSRSLLEAYGPVIEYLMGMSVNDDSTVVIDNTGTSKTTNSGLAYASNWLYLDGSTQSFDVDTGNSTNDKFLTRNDYATKSFIDVTIPVSDTFTETNSGQEWFVTTIALIPTDYTYLDANPNAVRRLWDGELVPELSFVKADMYTYYPANEGVAGGQYVQNVMQDLGTDISNQGNAWAVTNGDETTVIHSNTGGVVDFEVTVAGTWSIRPELSYNAGVPTKFPVLVEIPHSGDLTPLDYIAWLGVTYTPIVTATHILFIATHDNSSDPSVYIRYNGTSTGRQTLGALTARELTVAEIANYTVSCRTNLKNVNYGASNRLTKQNSTGRITGIADVYSGEYQDPDSRDDTQWDGTGYGYVEEVYHDGTDLVHFLYLANGDRYKNSVSDGTFTMKALVGGTIHIDEKSFDGVATTITQRGVFRMSKSTLSSQAKIDAVYSEAVELYTTYLTDESGNYLTDESDNYLVAEQKLTPL